MSADFNEGIQNLAKHEMSRESDLVAIQAKLNQATKRLAESSQREAELRTKVDILQQTCAVLRKQVADL